MSDFFYLNNYVNQHFALGEMIDHERISNQFIADINANMDNPRFERLLITSGFIPDLYGNDSSEETLFTKLIECLVSVWASRIGATGELIKQKSSFEDIKITIADRVIVCDAKSFRLGRSQQAPNAKDFLKLEDIRKWMYRYQNSIGGLVTYPCKHEWSTSSDIYQYCSSKEVPTVMLPYKYMAYFLHYKANFTPNELVSLWDYQNMFPQKLQKEIPGGNKVKYWDMIRSKILQITQTNQEQFANYMNEANILINQYITETITELTLEKERIIKNITNEIANETNVEDLRRMIIEYKIKTETDLLNKILQRIRNFR